ncbi:general stress protein [Indiicoccus explosivorum]|uniref:general stress protein n=1 Tax=Indiicoccus explosivorum TaxID=1917864 RepID=UPI000B445402|nr:general stress protein [Indiicoccus explosivorum]
MKSEDRKVEVVYTQGEFDQKLDELKGQGYEAHDLHVLSNNEDKLVDREKHDVTRFKSFYTESDINEERMRTLNLTDQDAGKFKDDLSNGAAIIYTDHQVPYRDRINDRGVDIGDKFDDGLVIAAGTNFEGDDTDVEPVGQSPADHKRRRTNNEGESHVDPRYEDTRYVTDRDVTGDHVQGRNTALSPFGRDIERDELRHDDPQIDDEDVEKGERTMYSEERGRSDDGRREHGAPIHPSSSDGDLEPASPARDNHEPPMVRRTEEEADEKREHPYEDEREGVNRSDDEPSPGNDPNLGPAPFGRDSEEQHLMEEKERRGRDVKGDERVKIIDKRDKNYEERRDDDLPPSPRFF